jgi:murein DD-endopeptidase MepM/ murein hydrolase activator NlpD
MSSLFPRLAALVAPVLLVGVLAVAPARAAAEPVPVGVWPLKPAPEVVAGFDPPDAPWGSGHRGVDLLGAPGQAVHAALAGTVSFAGVLAGRGVVVVVHGDTRTTYEPVEATVEVGQVVGRDEVIGHLQGVASHCPPQACLHWGWLRGPTYLDPLDLVGGRHVRLLPLWRDAPVAVTGALVTGLETGPWSTAYAAVLRRIETLVARSPPAVYARGCACW